MPQAHVVVIGAGVIGLTCAVNLARRGLAVTVLARDLPGDTAIEYASPQAGAHFRPTPVRTQRDAVENTYMRESYDELRLISQSHPTAGVDFVPAVEYFDAVPAEDDLAMFAEWPGFRILSSDELPSHSNVPPVSGTAAGGIKTGLTYDAWVLNSPVYLAWLQAEAERAGAVVARVSLSAVQEAFFRAIEQRDETFPAPSTIVNASGMGFGDGACFPSRGQFIRVSNTYHSTVSHHAADGQATVVIPRPSNGGTVIGGTKQPHNWSPMISDAATDEILRRVATLCPDMLQSVTTNPEQQHLASGLQVEEVYIGRRPMRTGGLRLEKEDVTVVQTASDGFSGIENVIPIVHCYGAGPSGYKISWGAAKRVCEMVCGSD